MNIFLQSIIFITIFNFNHSTLLAQAKIKEKKEIAFGLANQDTTFRFQKISNYDEQGRLTYRQNYYYHPVQKGVLTKEEKSIFDISNQTLTEYIITYVPNKDPSSQKLVTRYLDYQIKEENSKRIARQYYDEHGEISREDTLTYNANQDLVELSAYDYRGNTSLFTDYYTYNKKGLKTKWITLSKWTTIDMKGQVAERHEKRRNHIYRYNKNGQLIRASGFYYLTRFQQKISYDKNGKIAEDKTTVKRKTRQSVTKEKKTAQKVKTNGKSVEDKTTIKAQTKQAGTKEKPTLKKFKIDTEEQILLYQNGRLISDTKRLNKAEMTKTEIIYLDSLVQTVKITEKQKLIDSTGYEYLNTNLLSKKTQTKYTSDGRPRYSLLTYYNEKGKAIKEEQMMGNKILSVLESQYDEYGNPILQSLSMNNSPVSEKTTYIYIYY